MATWLWKLILQGLWYVSWGFRTRVLNVWTSRIILSAWSWASSIQQGSLYLLMHASWLLFMFERSSTGRSPIASPFYLVKEAFARWLDYSIDNFRLSVHSRLPRYLFYADDIIIFLEAIRANGRNVHRLLLDYICLFGHVYNQPKSHICYGNKAMTHLKNYICWCSVINIGSLMFTYLSVPIFRGTSKICHLTAIADNVIQKFTRWKGNTMSLVDLRCLINSVIYSSLIHTRWSTNGRDLYLRKLKLSSVVICVQGYQKEWVFECGRGVMLRADWWVRL